MIFADTGFFVAMINDRDSLHEHACTWAISLAQTNQEILTTEQVLWESLNHTASTMFRYDAAVYINELRNDRKTNIIWSELEGFSEAFDLYRNRLDKSWSLTDCLSFCVMNQYHITDALAYDLDFEQAGFRPLLRESPPR